MSGGRASSTDFDKKKFDIIANKFDKINFLKLLKSSEFIEFLNTDDNKIKAFIEKNGKVLKEIIKQKGGVLIKIMEYNKEEDIKEIYYKNKENFGRIANIIQRSSSGGGSDSDTSDDEDFELRKSLIYIEIAHDIILFLMFIFGSGSLLEFLNDLL